MGRFFLFLIAVAAGACRLSADPPSGSHKDDLVDVASSDAKFDECVTRLMRGEEAKVRGTVQAQFRLSPDDAHDLVRDAMVSVCVQHAEHGYVSLEAALQRAAYNRGRDDWRKKRRYPQCAIDETVPTCDATDASLRFDQEERAVEAAMCKLDRSSETIVRRRMLEELDFATLGRDLGLTAESARTKYYNAIKKLRHDLGVACPAAAEKNRPTSYTTSRRRRR